MGCVIATLFKVRTAANLSVGRGELRKSCNTVESNQKYKIFRVIKYIQFLYLKLRPHYDMKCFKIMGIRPMVTHKPYLF